MTGSLDEFDLRPMTRFSRFDILRCEVIPTFGFVSFPPKSTAWPVKRLLFGEALEAFPFSSAPLPFRGSAAEVSPSVKLMLLQTHLAPPPVAEAAPTRAAELAVSGTGRGWGMVRWGSVVRLLGGSLVWITVDRSLNFD